MCAGVRTRCAPLALLPPHLVSQLALEAAEQMLDIAAAGEGGSWDELRAPLADAYQRGGLADVANFIKAA